MTNSEIVRTPRERFKELRKAKGTQREVAAALGITESFLRMLENGYNAPSVELLFKTCHYFETDVYDLWPDLAGNRPEISTECN